MNTAIATPIYNEDKTKVFDSIANQTVFAPLYLHRWQQISMKIYYQNIRI